LIHSERRPGQYIETTSDAVLGPKPFVPQVKKALWTLGVPDQQVRYEFFRPASALE
jgi:ferredoxin-NADP reductase